MEHNEELKAHLMATSEEFRSLVERHTRLKQQLEAIEAKPRLTLEDEHQEHQIKKQKLHLKDQMNSILAHYKTQHVA
ncbi:MAG TPA: YdcH family protein [Bryobacteraceae bacterium]|nr:YdcH family protein [Bryobacteraceae bacterium]